MDSFNLDLSPLTREMEFEADKIAKEIGEANAYREARSERIAADVKAIRENTDSIVDYFYQSMINLDILNRTLEKSGAKLDELTEIKDINSKVLSILQEQEFQTEKERLDLVSRMMKVDTGLPLVNVIQEIILYIYDNYEFKN